MYIDFKEEKYFKRIVYLKIMTIAQAGMLSFHYHLKYCAEFYLFLKRILF